MPEYAVTDIVWDTDGHEQEGLGLPSSAQVFCDDPEEIADTLSSEFGWLVSWFDYQEVAV